MHAAITYIATAVAYYFYLVLRGVH